MESSAHPVCTFLIAAVILPVLYYAYHFFNDPLRKLSGPPVRGFFGDHMSLVLKCVNPQSLLVDMTKFTL
jgi:hypothetical protein